MSTHYQNESAKKILSDILQHSPSEYLSFRLETEKIIDFMFKQNPNIEPDSLTRAALLVAKSKYSSISPDDVKRIRNNGGRLNYLWPALIPIIRKALEQQK